MTTLLRAKYVLPMVCPPIPEGAVAVKDGLVTNVGRWSDLMSGATGEVVDLGEVALMPGLINAHCHLDYTDMVGHVPWRGNFLDWVLQITKLKKSWTSLHYASSIQRGREMLLRNGTTSVVNITCDPSLVDDLAPMPLRTWWCPELIDLTWTEESARMAATVAEWVEAHPPCGVSPHAPYTVSDGLYQLLAKLARDQGWLLTTHAAESREEDEMWRWSRGHMFDRYRRGGEGGAVRHLANLGVLGRNCLLAHANFLSDDEAGLIVRSGASVVHCPRTHAFFGRPPAPLAQWQRHGINVCLGTDSMASNDRLDMFAEMRELIRAWPGISPETALRMATVNGAAALNREGQLGCLAVGAVADLVAVPVSAEVADPYESVVYSGASLSYAMIGGKEIQHEQHR